MVTGNYVIVLSDMEEAERLDPHTFTVDCTWTVTRTADVTTEDYYTSDPKDPEADIEMERPDVSYSYEYYTLDELLEFARFAADVLKSKDPYYGGYNMSLVQRSLKGIEVTDTLIEED